jgi:hypothetical protein
MTTWDEIKRLIAEEPNVRHHSSPEAMIQASCFEWFNVQYPQYRGLFFAIENGGKRPTTTAARLKKQGVTAGVADTMLAVPTDNCPGLWIEFKTMQGRQSPAQKDWQEIVESVGYRYTICRSLDEFMNLIKSYLNDR